MNTKLETGNSKLENQTIRRGGFLAALLGELMADCYSVQDNNVDFLRFPSIGSSYWSRFKSRLNGWFVRLAQKRNCIYVDPSIKNRISERLEFILENLGCFEKTYALLADQSSRNLMVALAAHRLLGGSRVKLATNNPKYWGAHEAVKKLIKRRNAEPLTFSCPYADALDLFELRPVGLPISLYAASAAVMNVFLLEQYRHSSRNGSAVEVELGDTVIDAGGCWGDTALYFANRAGESGRVHCFELSPKNLAILNKNLKQNPYLAGRVRVIQKAVWDKTGESLSFSEIGSSSSLTNGNQTDQYVETVTIDDFVRESNMRRVDFLKMDIEGAEMRALKGARETLKEFRPKLAISVYHKPEDLITIMNYLNALNAGYKFYLGHVTIHHEETMLFCKANRETNAENDQLSRRRDNSVKHDPWCFKAGTR